MKHIRFIFVLILMVGIIINSCKKEEEKGSINGIATSALTNEPLEGVNITLSPKKSSSVTTGIDGKYTFNDLQVGEYQVQVIKTGYESSTKNVTVTANNTTTADISLSAIVPILNVSVNNLDFGRTNSSLPIDIINIGGNILEWSVSENVDWISVNPTSGSVTNETDAIMVNVDRSGLTQGNHSQNISIISNGGSKTIGVTLNNTPPFLTITPENLNFGSTDLSKQLTLSNTGIGALSFVATSNDSWLKVSPANGSIADQLFSVNVTIEKESLIPGNYSGSITFITNTNEVLTPVTMTVLASSAPVVSSGPATEITSDGAKVSGNISSTGSSAISQHGHCWGLNPNPTVDDFKTLLGSASGTGIYYSTITGLEASTTYYVSAYATNLEGTSYGETIQFTTSALSLPYVTTTAPYNITSNSATSGGNVVANNNLIILESEKTTSDSFHEKQLFQGGNELLSAKKVANVTARGVCWSTSSNPTVSDSHTTDGLGTGTFISNITGLSENTKYYVKAYATNSTGTAYGDEYSFTTLSEPIAPNVSTASTSNITQSSATSGGNVESDGGATVTARGVCWSTSSNPSLFNSHTTNGSGTGEFTSALTGLNQSTTYHVRAYATNSVGTSYGNDVTFTSLSAPIIPSVTTANATDIAQTTASSGGNVTSDGGSTVTARGVCWSTSSNPTISNSHTTDGSGTGAFTSVLTGLSQNTTYHVRAYATNSVGTAYGAQITFTTLIQTGVPTVTTTNATNITQTTASSGGNVTSDGGATVTARGVCWSTSSNPTISNSHTTDGSGTGAFTSNVTGLSQNTTYHVRAYATNSAGTAYGNDITFTTLAEPVIPSVTTANATNITQTTASSGGNVTSDGGATVTARGVCWSTSSNPTVSNSHTTDGSGTGAFTSNITGLSQNTTYHVRAYATNSAGTAYGNDITFTTLAEPVIPSVTTANATNITQTTASSGGNVTSDGGATVTARGVCWSTSSNPTVSNSHTTDGSGTGAFTSNITGLTQNTTYYVRAYATNSVGTAYGNQEIFLTLGPPTLPVVSTGSATNITSYSIDMNGIITDLGDGYVINHGFCYATNINPTIDDGVINLGSTTTIGDFSGSITGLTEQTTYYIRAYATNSIGTSYGGNVGVATTEILPVVMSGLVAYYTYDDQTANDYFGIYNGIMQGCQASSDIPNPSGYSMEFVASENDYYQTTQNPLNGLTTLSSNVWIKTSSNGVIFSGGNDPNLVYFRIEIYQNNVRFNTGSASYMFNLDVTNLLLNNQWHMLTVTCETLNNGSRLYVDGVLVSQHNKGLYSITTNGNDCLFGKTYGSGGYAKFFDGKMDNLRIYNRVLSQSEITEIYTTVQ